MPCFGNTVRSRLAVSAFLIFLSSYGYVLASTILSEDERRVVSQIDGSKATLTLGAPEVLSVGSSGDISAHVRLPAGIYILVAEDEDYLFYQAPKPIEYHVDNYGQYGVPVSVDYSSGGIYVSKAAISPDRMGIYRNTDAIHKILEWKFGARFIDNERSKWVRN